MVSIPITSSGQRVAAELFTPYQPGGEAVLFIHGWSSSKDSPRSFAEALARQGYTCLTFDLRGMGESEGDIKVLSRRDYLGDCLAAFDVLAAQPGVKSISVAGSSFGSYLACLLTEQRTVHSLVLRVPADYPDEGYDRPQSELSHPVSAWRASQDRAKETYPIQALRHYRGRVLVVESEHDDSIPHSSLMQFVAAAANRAGVTHRLMKGAPHSLTTPQLQSEYRMMLLDWFAR